MKKTINIMTFILLFLGANQSIGQIRFGALGGLNIANMKLNDLPSEAKQSSNISFQLGGIIEYGISESFGIQSGLFISGKGTKIEYKQEEGGISSTSKSSISPMYLEIPVNALYKIDLGASKLQLFAGPYLGLGIGGNIKSETSIKGLPTGDENESNTTNIKYGSSPDSDLKRLDLGLNFGIGFEVKNILIRGQYGLGLSTLDPRGSDIKNRVIGISVGYLFGGN